jgi:hypothetical protein
MKQALVATHEHQSKVSKIVVASLLAAILLILSATNAYAEQGPIPGTANLSEAEEATSAESDFAVMSISEFTSSLDLRSAEQLAGVYVPGEFAFPVIQQPSNNPGFVSSEEKVITEFGLASKYGTTGLLAHNTAAGANFFQLEAGQSFMLVMGDGSLRKFIVSGKYSYQALSPHSPYSDFIELENGSRLTSTQLFFKFYEGDGQLVFQTCIENEGDYSWGRIFITAVPAETLRSNTILSRLTH